MSGSLFSIGKEKNELSKARRVLMLPHPGGDAEAIAEAFDHCARAFRSLDENKLEAQAREWVRNIEDFMDTAPQNPAQWVVKAEEFTNEQKRELSESIDNLAHWFERNFGFYS